MRRRLLVVLLVFSVLAVAGFAVPLLGSTAANRTSEFVASRSADAARFAALAQGVIAGGSSDQLRAEVAAHTGLFGDAVVIVDARRRVIVAEGMRAGDPEVAAAVDAALRNQPRRAPEDLRPWSSGDVLFSQPIGTGIRVAGAVVLRTSVQPAVADIGTRWALILLGALAALVVAVLLVLRLARWVLRPVDQLARGMHRMTEGREHTQVDVVSGPPELRGLTEEFNHMSDALAESAQRQRALVADVSHQLRNPMAALRLRLDNMASSAGQPGTGSAPRSMLVEVERLEALLDGMLALASADSAATDLAAAATDAHCDAAAVLAERLEAWHDAAADGQVRLAGAGEAPGAAPGELPVNCTESELAQVLDVVLDNAIKYAGPHATVGWSAQLRDGYTVLELADDGPGVPAVELSRLTERFWRAGGKDRAPGSGLGLAIAERLVTARGGRFVLRAGEPSGLVVGIELPGVPQKTSDNVRQRPTMSDNVRHPGKHEPA